MERQIPGGEPWVFPFIRHGNDITAHHVKPLAVTNRHRTIGSARSVFPEPLVYFINVDLLAPKHASESLTNYLPGVRICRVRSEGGVKLVRVAFTGLKGLIELCSKDVAAF